MRYPNAEQDRHYRQAARDRGCTCWADLPAGVHALGCPLYAVPGGVPSELHEHLDQEHDADDGRPWL